MLPPPALQSALEEYDKGLRVRWSDPVGQYCIERRHGIAGLEPDAVIGMLHDKWQRLEKDKQASDEDRRAAYDEFDARRQGYQPIFYVHPSEAGRVPDIICILVGMDIRKAGGAHAWAQAHKEHQESLRRMIRAQRKERLRNLAEQAYDKAAMKKDFHASGGDAFFCPVDLDNSGKPKE